MNWKFFLASRIYRSKDGRKEVSRPAVRLAVTGIAIGLAVMIVSVAVVTGFKHTVRDNVIGMGADVLVTSLDDAQSYQMSPIDASDSLLRILRTQANVHHVQRYATKPGMIMTSDHFQGMVLKGVGQEYNLEFLRAHMLEGSIPAFTDSTASNQVLLSRSIADKLGLKVGDRLFTYYLEGEIRARRLTVAGIYQTNFSTFDDLFLLTDLCTVVRLNNWQKGQVGGLEISVDDHAQSADVSDRLHAIFHGYKDRYGTSYFPRSVEEVYPQIFAWLDLLDVNVWVILILMTGVAGFTMISGLLIIILEHTGMIGILKALGADNTSIRKVFLSFSVLLIRKGMLWGNVIGLGFCVLQYYTKLFRLDPTTYYVDSVPVEIHIPVWILLNVCTFFISVLMLIGPSYLVSRIHPARTIRFE